MDSSQPEGTMDERTESKRAVFFLLLSISVQSVCLRPQERKRERGEEGMDMEREEKNDANGVG